MYARRVPAFDRLSLPLGEAIFTQRAIRCLKPEPIADDDLRLILQAAGRAPSARNRQPWHFLVLKDPERKRQLQELFQEDWWTRRGRAGIHTIEDVPAHDRATLRLLAELAQAPVLILACAVASTVPNEVLAAAQNLLLAARGLGIGGTLTRFGPTIDPITDGRVKQTFGIPAEVEIQYVIPLGYAPGQFGPVQRKELRDIVSLDTWNNPAPFATQNRCRSVPAKAPDAMVQFGERR